MAASEAIPAQLQSMLREKGYSVTVRNAGIYGNTTTQMRARMDSDIPEGTTIVILDTSGGSYNDNRLGVSREQGEADLAAIKARLADRHIKVIPISGTDVPPQYHQQDGIHLTPEGHRIAASNVLPEVMAGAGAAAVARCRVPEPAQSVHCRCASTLRGGAWGRRQTTSMHAGASRAALQGLPAGDRREPQTAIRVNDLRVAHLPPQSAGSYAFTPDLGPAQWVHRDRAAIHRQEQV